MTVHLNRIVTDVHYDVISFVGPIKAANTTIYASDPELSYLQRRREVRAFKLVNSRNTGGLAGPRAPSDRKIGKHVGTCAVGHL